MSTSQCYETTIYDDQSDLGITIISIPKRYVQNFDLLKSAADVADLLGLYPDLVLAAPEPAAALIAALSDPNKTLLDPRTKDPTNETAIAANFVNYVMSEAWIPVEQSPLVGEKLGQLTSKGPGAVGAAVGVYVSGGDPVMAMLLVPAGMLLCFAAQGIGEGLHIGLRRRVEDVLRKKRKPTNRSTAQKNTPKLRGNDSGAG